MDPITAHRNTSVPCSSVHPMPSSRVQTGLAGHKDGMHSLEKELKKTGCIGCMLAERLLLVKDFFRKALHFFLSFFLKEKNEQTADVQPSSINLVSQEEILPPPAPMEEPPLLPELTQQMQEDTRFIITTLANAPIYNIPTAELRERGKALESSHPLSYLAYIGSDATLSIHLKEMKNRSMGIIWTRYNDEFCKRLKEYNRQQPFLPHLPVFAEKTGLALDLLQSLVERQAFLEMMNHLADRATQRAPRSEADPNEGRSLPSSAGYDMPQQLTTALELEVEETTLPLVALEDTMKEKLSLVFDKIANLSTLSLTMQASEIKNRWKEIAQAHPLSILFEIFSSPTLQAHLKVIFSSILRKEPFLNDLCTALSKARSAQELTCSIPAFANALEVDPLIVTSLTISGNKNDWKKLVNHLYQRCEVRS